MLYQCIFPQILETSLSAVQDLFCSKIILSFQFFKKAGPKNLIVNSLLLIWSHSKKSSRSVTWDRTCINMTGVQAKPVLFLFLILCKVSCGISGLCRNRFPYITRFCYISRKDEFLKVVPEDDSVCFCLLRQHIKLVQNLTSVTTIAYVILNEKGRSFDNLILSGTQNPGCQNIWTFMRVYGKYSREQLFWFGFYSLINELD